MNRFEAAPWPTGLKIISALSTLILLGVSYFLARAVPRGTRVPFAETFGTGITVLPLAIALISLLFIVSGYEIEPEDLLVRRLFWSTRISLDGISRAVHDPLAMKRSLRLFGNGGLFAITGIYQNRTLGRYRAFATDPRKAVVLFLARRIVVVTPADPAAFLEALHMSFPAISTRVSGGPAGSPS
ncbi:MAG TPA: PH domain-containing protein [Thermoanaerobaculia bacterium]